MRADAKKSKGRVQSLVHRPCTWQFLPTLILRIKWLHGLRTCFATLLLLTVLSAAGVLWWANYTGMPPEWRAAIEEQLAKEGYHVRIARLSYLPLRGLLIDDLRIYSDPAREKQISRLERVLLDVDKTKLARGKLDISKLELKDAQLEWPVRPEDPQSPMLTVSQANGTILWPSGRLLEIRNVRGNVAGIQLAFDARLLGYRQITGATEDPAAREARRRMLERSLKELASWRFDPAKPPTLAVHVEGDLANASTLRATYRLDASSITHNGFALRQISLDGDFASNAININALRAQDSSGTFAGHGDYSFSTRRGRFDIQSSLNLPGLAKAWFGQDPPREVAFRGGLTLDATGNFHLPGDAEPDFSVVGQVKASDFSVRKVAVDRLETAFSTNGKDVYLYETRIKQGARNARGQLLIKNRLGQFAAAGDLPIATLKPFFRNQPLERVLNDFTEKRDTRVDADVAGTFDLDDLHNWSVQGRAKVTNTAFRGVPLVSAETRMSLDHDLLDFNHGEVVFDYSNYALRNAHDGPATGTVKLDSIKYESAGTRKLHIDDVRGEFYPAPLLRLFAPNTAAELEDYRFHRPPVLAASGLVDLRDNDATDLTVNFKCNGIADYDLFEKSVSLTAPSGNVRIRKDEVKVDNLRFRAFDGPCEATIIHRDDRRNDGLQGEVRWTKISLPAIADCYGFDSKQGQLTGRLEFACNGKQASTVQGKGLIALEGAELFSVPIFGPLSPIISGVLMNRNMGFERAREAFCSFVIRDGVIRTNDFRTATTSLAFTGDGSVNLTDRTMLMTMRMNARGLLSVITLPLRPFYGLFQFRGSGPVGKPNWENVMFTSPPEDQKDALLNPPKAKIVSPP